LYSFFIAKENILETLHLNLKTKHWDRIESGEKPWEYRLMTDYWKKRLLGKSFDRILVKKGYPKRDDKSRILERPWRGLEVHTITHDEFGHDPVDVFAIRVNP
jgi:hypothetical protein